MERCRLSRALSYLMMFLPLKMSDHFRALWRLLVVGQGGLLIFCIPPASLALLFLFLRTCTSREVIWCWMPSCRHGNTATATSIINIHRANTDIIKPLYRAVSVAAPAAWWPVLLVGLCSSCSVASAASDGTELFTVSSEDPLARAFLWVGVGILVMLSGLFAGLGLGFMGLDKIGLEIVASAGDPESARCAKVIVPVRRDGNLLLVSLLTGNVAVNVLISILMSDLTSGLYGFIISTLLIVIIGDIVPQAICSRHALQIGARAVPIVRVIEVLLYPVAKPMAIILDLVLGDELGTIHSRHELLKLLQIHVKHGSVDPEAGNILTGALSYSDIKVSEVMTPIASVFSLPLDGQLDYKTVSTIFKSGFSRIPIYAEDKQDIMGLLFTKDLILVDPGDCTSIKNFMAFFGRSPACVWPETPLHEVLGLFKSGKGHMALVKDVVDKGPGDPYFVVSGIVTLEDVVRYILGGGIADEPLSSDMMALNHVDLDRGQFNTSRLRLLDRTVKDERLAPAEVKAVSAYLLGHVGLFKRMQAEEGRDFVDKLSFILSVSPVVTLGGEGGRNSTTVQNGSSLSDSSSNTAQRKRQPSSGAKAGAGEEKKDSNGGLGLGEGRKREEAENAVYRKGKVATFCTVVLNGKLSVACGGDDFLCDAGPWTVLAAESLTVEEGQYISDFTATIPPEEETRCVQIDSSTFRKYMLPPPPPPQPPSTQTSAGSGDVFDILGGGPESRVLSRRSTPRSALLDHDLHSPPGGEVTPSGMVLSPPGGGPGRPSTPAGADPIDRLDLLRALAKEQQHSSGSSVDSVGVRQRGSPTATITK